MYILRKHKLLSIFCKWRNPNHNLAIRIETAIMIYIFKSNLSLKETCHRNVLQTNVIWILVRKDSISPLWIRTSQQLLSLICTSWNVEKEILRTSMTWFIWLFTLIEQTEIIKDSTQNHQQETTFQQIIKKGMFGPIYLQTLTGEENKRNELNLIHLSFWRIQEEVSYNLYKKFNSFYIFFLIFRYKHLLISLSKLGYHHIS